MDRLVGRRNLVLAPTVFGRHAVQLAVDVGPLAHAQRGEEVGVAGLNQLAVRLLVLDFVVVPLPKFEPGEEFGFFVGELLVRRVGRALLLLRPLARVLRRKRGGDDQHFLETAFVARRDDHPRDARVEWQLGEFLADRGECPLFGDGTELLQELVTVADRLGWRRLKEGEGFDVAEAQRLHAQDDAGQRRTQDLGVGKGRPPGEVVLGVEADADAGRDPAAAPGALVGRGLRDLFDLQLLDLVAVGIALDARQARINDVADARHGERGLGDVGRQHDAPTLVRAKDARLFLGREAGEERQDFGARPAAGEGVLAQRLAGLANLALAGQENEDVARTEPRHFVAGIDDGVVKVTLVVVLGFLHLHRPVAHIDGIQAPRDLDHRRIVEVLGEALGVDGRRGDDDFQVGALGQELLEETEQEVDVQAALVRLVDDQRVILRQPRIALRLGEQDAVGHQFDVRARRGAVGEADLIADQLAELAFQLLRDARRRRTRGDAARLSMADESRRPAPEFKADLGQLRRFARAGFAANDDHLMLLDQFGDLGAPRIDRQLLGELRSRQAGTARGDGGARFLQQRVVFGLRHLAPGPVELAQLARQRAQAATVGGKAIGDGIGTRTGWLHGAGTGNGGKRDEIRGRSTAPEKDADMPDCAQDRWRRREKAPF